MHTIKFLEYNDLQKKIMSEEETLENIFDLVVEGKPSEIERQALLSAETWAEYAFENNKEYHLVIYSNDKPLVHITNSTIDIAVNFLTYHEGKLFKHLTMVYDKYNTDILFDEGINQSFENNNIFLSKIEQYTLEEEKEAQNEMVFQLNGEVNVFTTVLDKKNNKTSTEAKKTKVNISHNFIRSPQNYTDYEYLLDYKSILKPEYLDIV